MTEDREPATNNQIGNENNSIGDTGSDTRLAQGQENIAGDNNKNVNLYFLNATEGVLQELFSQNSDLLFELLNRAEGAPLKQFNSSRFSSLDKITRELHDPRSKIEDSGLVRLAQFIRHDQRVSQEHKVKLQQIFDEIKQKEEIDLEAMKEPQSTEWVLQVAISNRAEGFNSQSGQNYHLLAWINQAESNTPAENFFDPDQNETFAFDLIEIGNMVYELIKKAEQMGRKIKQVEFFLPYEHLILPVDRSKHVVEDRDSKRKKILKLINRYPIVVRSHDRAFANISKSSALTMWNNWEDKWKHLTTHKKSLLLAVDPADCLDDLHDLIDGDCELGCSWLKLDPNSGLDPKEIEDLFRDLIFFGIPILIWFHKSGLEEHDLESLFEAFCNALFEEGITLPDSSDDFIDGADTLAEKINKVRQSRGARRNKSHIGNHLAVMLDGPDFENLPKAASDTWRRKLR